MGTGKYNCHFLVTKFLFAVLFFEKSQYVNLKVESSKFFVFFETFTVVLPSLHFNRLLYLSENEQSKFVKRLPRM